MKRVKLIGFIAVLAVIVFAAVSITACDDPDKPAGAAVTAPTLNSKNSNSITVNEAAFTSGNPGDQTIEYGRNTANSAPTSWQDGRTFTGLNTNTTYYIFARSKENATHNAGQPSWGLAVTTDPYLLTGAAVSTPVLNSKNSDSITINAASFAFGNPGGQTIEYGRNTTNTAPVNWQDGVTFTGLNANTTYYIFARSKANATHNAGQPSLGLLVTTDPPLPTTGAAVSTPTLNSKDTHSITINAASFTFGNPGGQTIEYGRNTTNTAPASWQDGRTFTGLNANTTYYIFARSKANATHNAGQPSLGLLVATTAPEFDPNSVDTALNGTWVYTDGGYEDVVKLYNGNMETSSYMFTSPNLVFKGTYTTNNGKYTQIVTHLLGDTIGADSRWYSINELRALENITISDNRITVNHYFGGSSWVLIEYVTDYSISDDILYFGNYSYIRR